MEYLAKLVVFLPLFSATYNGLFYALFRKERGNNTAAIIASICMIIASISAICLFIDAGVNKNTIHLILTPWVNLGKSSSFVANWAIYVDQLTAIMFLLVTLVSTVVHIYSLGYMKDDDNLPKFLSYLSLFTFCMLALVSADNFLQLFFGWEGVGVCSYLLIGYYFKKTSANAASIKAFVANRIGDFALVIGIILLYLNVGTIEFSNLSYGSEANTTIIAVPDLAEHMIGFWDYEISRLDIICLLLFVGCMGKSAQIGLHVWLPDAMEGPTPVSALIHAATMVTAGVFLLARCSFMYEHSPLALGVIAVIGAITCLFAASIAIAQDDIKKIIAYSTCSQLGYMFFACGVSAYEAGIFHLVTHGFFKALLFLSAGSIIHSVHEQDIFKIRALTKGVLAKRMPITYMNFWLGSLAIIGIYPFAGFYSKDLILESAYAAGEAGSTVANFAFIFGIVAAVITAIYSMKIIMITFHGKDVHEDVASQISDTDSKKTIDDAHESPKIMNTPLFLLSAGALFAGMVGFYILNIADISGYFAGSIYKSPSAIHGHHFGLIIKLMPLIAGLLGMAIGFYFYKGKMYQCMSTKMGLAFRILKNKYYFDEIYDKVFVKSLSILSCFSNVIDKQVVDKYGPNAAYVVTRTFAWCSSQVQTGYIFNYTLYIILSLVICISVFLGKYYYYSIFHFQ